MYIRFWPTLHITVDYSAAHRDTSFLRGKCNLMSAVTGSAQFLLWGPYCLCSHLGSRLNLKTTYAAPTSILPLKGPALLPCWMCRWKKLCPADLRLWARQMRWKLLCELCALQSCPLLLSMTPGNVRKSVCVCVCVHARVCLFVIWAWIIVNLSTPTFNDASWYVH